MSKEELSGVWHGALGLNVTGSNVVEFLQGYLTCNLDRLSESSTLPMTLCNLKGRVIVSGWVYQRATDHLELIVHESLTERLKEVLAPYARFSRCDLSISEQPPRVHLNSNGEILFGLSGPDIDVASEIEKHLIDSSFAWVTNATSEMYLPQVLELHTQSAVDFDKGCYLGQEIVARAQFRGSVKKHLVSFVWEGDPPEAGSENADGDTVISVTASVENPNQGNGLAVS